MEPTGTIMDTIRAAMRSPAPSPEMIKRAEEFKKRKDAGNRTDAVSGTNSDDLDDLSKMFND